MIKGKKRTLSSIVSFFLKKKRKETNKESSFRFFSTLLEKIRWKSLE